MQRRPTTTAQATMAAAAVLGRASENEEILGRKRLHELVAQSSAAERVDADAEEILLDFVEDFVETAAVGAARLAKHRKGTTLEPADLLLFLEQAWGLTIPTAAAAAAAGLPASAIVPQQATVAAAESGGGGGGVFPPTVLPAALPVQGQQKVTKHQERLSYVRKLRK